MILQRNDGDPTRHAHSNYTSVAWPLVLAAPNHMTDRNVDKESISDVPRELPMKKS
jgi:hypothetical protein